MTALRKGNLHFPLNHICLTRVLLNNSRWPPCLNLYIVDCDLKLVEQGTIKQFYCFIQPKTSSKQLHLASYTYGIGIAELLKSFCCRLLLLLVINPKLFASQHRVVEHRLQMCLDISKEWKGRCKVSPNFCNVDCIGIFFC